jgi:hypothetical protein
LDVVVGQSTSILKLLSGEDQTLLVRGNSFFVLDLGFDIVDGIGGLDLKGDGLAREGFDEAVESLASVFVRDHRRGNWRGVPEILHLHWKGNRVSSRLLVIL